MIGITRRWVWAAAVGAVGAGAPLAGGPGAVARRVGEDTPDSASAQALLAAVRGVPEPVCELVTVALRNSYSVGAGSRALGYGRDEVLAGGPAAWAVGSMRTPDAIPVLSGGLRDQDA